MGAAVVAERDRREDMRRRRKGKGRGKGRGLIVEG
jgi:hypothetical protein